MIGWRDGKMSRQTELVILVGGVSINMSRRWRWETQRVNNNKYSTREGVKAGRIFRR